MHRTLSFLAALSLVATLLAGCGGHAPIVTRDGNAWQCGQQLRRTPNADPLLGWVSISSLDRWIAAVDRIGQRAGQFAPGSSVRETALSTAEEKSVAMGIKNLRWLDMTRPIHALMQADASNPMFGFSLVLPVSDKDKATQAVAALRTDFKSEGHDLVLDLQKADARGTGRKPLWIKWLDHGTALAALNPERIAAADTLARCVETRQPRELLHVGVAVSDLMARHRQKFTAMRGQLLALAKSTGQDDALFTYWSKRLEQVLGATDAAILLASAGEQDVSVGLSLFAKAGTELATGWSHQAKLTANPMASLLPDDAWLAMTQSYDPTVSAAEMKVMMQFYTAAMKVPAANAADFEALIKEMLSLIGPHSAVAMYRDGRFPLGVYGVMQAKDPKRLLVILGEVVLQSVKISVTRMLEKWPPGSQTAGLVSKVNEAINLGWSGMTDALIAKSQTWPVLVSHHKQALNKLRCQTLRMTPTPSALATMGGRMRAAAAFIPTKLDLSVCAGIDKLHIGFGPKALDRITAAAARTHRPLTKSRWFIDASQLGGKTAQTVFALNPGPLVAIAQALMPKLPAWPEGAALSMSCLYAPSSLRCDLRVPVVIADFFAAMRGDR